LERSEPPCEKEQDNKRGFSGGGLGGRVLGDEGKWERPALHKPLPVSDWSGEGGSPVPEEELEKIGPTIKTRRTSRFNGGGL